MDFRIALPSELEEVLSLYKSAIGSEFCVWDENYPSRSDIINDIETNNLYVLTEGGKIIGAAAKVSVKEYDRYGCFAVNNESAELARVVIAQGYRGKGLAYYMIGELITELRRLGVKSVHMSVACENIPALKTYLKHGFEIKLETFMYGCEYYLIEKLL